MLLCVHCFEGFALDLEHVSNIEEYLRFPIALFGLMRFEQEDLRCADHALVRIVAMRLGDDARFDCANH